MTVTDPKHSHATMRDYRLKGGGVGKDSSCQGALWEEEVLAATEDSRGIVAKSRRDMLRDASSALWEALYALSTKVKAIERRGVLLVRLSYELYEQLEREERRNEPDYGKARTQGPAGTAHLGELPRSLPEHPCDRD